ncbi:PREDICTED: serine/arginine repetitive matrix protein 3-like [Rhinopithecus bieti]|uniref:serine/arginine repetitive matrix protein 3-like n=1 Tax=Rhinopithecus bieti TaxID=61621 RepID=UPI00083C8899|nr:PREDICTED: serine/arginine repetitive matrix protein 3-like [Rhinopithecus bieti]
MAFNKVYMFLAFWFRASCCGQQLDPGPWEEFLRPGSLSSDSSPSWVTQVLLRGNCRLQSSGYRPCCPAVGAAQEEWSCPHGSYLHPGLTPGQTPRPDLVTAPFPGSVSGVGVWGAPWAAAGGAGVTTRAPAPPSTPDSRSGSTPLPTLTRPQTRSRALGPGVQAPHGRCTQRKRPLPLGGLREVSSKGGELRSGSRAGGARPRRAGREKRRRRELSGAPGGGRRRCRSRRRLRPQPGPRGVGGTRTLRPAARDEHGRSSPPLGHAPAEPSGPALGLPPPLTRGGPDFRVSGAPPWAGVPA